MVKRNPHIAKLNANYLFPEINHRKLDLLKRVPHADIISLGIGDTTEPIPPSIVEGLQKGVEQLKERKTYTGYGPEQGYANLRGIIASEHYHAKVEPSEIFISDGSKCDIGRLQMLFGADNVLGVQDPTYPAYADTGVAIGQTEGYHEGGYQKIVYLKCTPENHFFPLLDKLNKIDLLYFCSPNNPTGATATKGQLETLIRQAKKHHTLIIYDAAYSFYIRDPDLPKSIYEIEGAREIAIELNSLSKAAGFTGVRLGWSVVPKELKYKEGQSIQRDWLRIISTFFNGASNIAQSGAFAAFQPKGLKEIETQTNFYLENAKLIKEAWNSLGYKTYGGENSPYVWVHFPKQKSWEIFHQLLEKTHIIATPGSGFGPAGEEFMRFSAFQEREKVVSAISRLKRDFHLR